MLGSSLPFDPTDRSRRTGAFDHAPENLERAHKRDDARSCRGPGAIDDRGCDASGGAGNLWRTGLARTNRGRTATGSSIGERTCLDEHFQAFAFSPASVRFCFHATSSQRHRNVIATSSQRHRNATRDIQRGLVVPQIFAISEKTSPLPLEQRPTIGLRLI